MTPFPKIELHVHLEGTVGAQTLRQIAERNEYPLPDDLESLHRFRDFREFIEVFELTLGALQTYEDFRRIVVEYAAEAASHGAVYLEAIFVPGLWRGLAQDEVFGGYCDGAQKARELHDVEVRVRSLCEVPSTSSAQTASATASAPRRSPGLVRELAARGTVLDVCPLSNLRLGVVASLADHPLPRLVAAGVRCSISTDDPALFDTDLTRDYEAATSLGLEPRSFYEAGVAGALCDADTRARLRQLGESYDGRS